MNGWTWTLNWDRIRNDLIIGSCPMSGADLERIKFETDATAVLSVQTDLCREAFGIDYAVHVRAGRTLGLVLVNAPMRDFDPPDQRLRLPAAVRALHGLLAAGHRTYVHCTAGINRAPLTVLAYLIFVEEMAPEDAHALILAGRRAALPYWECYHGCREDLIEMARNEIALRARALSQGRPELSPETRWLQAERAVIRERIVQQPAVSEG